MNGRHGLISLLFTTRYLCIIAMMLHCFSGFRRSHTLDGLWRIMLRVILAYLAFIDKVSGGTRGNEANSWTE